MNSILEFLLDLILDWDEIEDYTQYHRVKEPAPLTTEQIVDIVPPVVTVSPKPVESNEISYRDIPLPIMRGGGLDVGDVEDFISNIDHGVSWHFKSREQRLDESRE